MKQILFIAVIFVSGICACKKSDFKTAYADPAKINATTVPKQFSGFLKSNTDYVLPSYWHYFVVLRITLNPYNQAVGWTNYNNQYIPGASATASRWDNYYGFLAQYRELQKVFATTLSADQTANRIFMIAATIYLYEHTEKMVDLYGDIPFSKAAMLSTNNGEYQNSYAAYDKADEIYTKMLDDLKAFATELNSINTDPGVMANFKNQDFINNGDIVLWKKYCNALRVRMLTRVSGVAAFQSRYSSEMAAITNAPAVYPLPATNADNILMDVYDLSSDINSKGFRTGLEDWNGNIAGKAMIDNMKTNVDPRLRVIFQPGDSAHGVFNGLDPLLDASTQASLISGGTMAIYNRSAISRNQFFPGVLMTVAELNYLLAEYFLNAGNDASAKQAYETGIRQSIEYYFWLRTISNDNSVASPPAPTAAEISNYLSGAAVSWTGAATKAARLNLIATQKWLHFNVVQPYECWSETRRLDAPVFSFWADASGTQKTPPARWLYPTSENTYNNPNYQSVKASDNLNTKIFWDVK